MGRGKGLVQVQVHDVEAGVAHPQFAENGVQIGAVVVEQGVHLAAQGHDLGQVALEQAQGVRHGHHDPAVSSSMAAARAAGSIMPSLEGMETTSKPAMEAEAGLVPRAESGQMILVFLLPLSAW
jgi:hypothetical protein